MIVNRCFPYSVWNLKLVSNRLAWQKHTVIKIIWGNIGKFVFWVTYDFPKSNDFVFCPPLPKFPSSHNERGVSWADSRVAVATNVSRARSDKPVARRLIGSIVS